MIDGTLITLTDAARRLDPTGKLTARSLRTEAERGRLQLIRIAGKYFVTEDALKEMIERCHASPKAPDCMSIVDQGGTPSGSYETDRIRKAQAAARATVAALKKPLRPTSPENTNP